MDTFTLRIFQREVKRQIDFFLLSVQTIDVIHARLKAADEEKRNRRILADDHLSLSHEEQFASISQGMKESKENNARRSQLTVQLWYSIQNLLIAAGNISKLLWGTNNGKPEDVRRRKQDRQQLRTSLGIAENSILRLSPEFRNHFEHLDERIEAWAVDSPERIWVDDGIGPSGMVSGIEPTNQIRSYDPTRHTLTFRGEVFEIGPLMRAVLALQRRAEAELAKPHWESPGQSASTAGGGQ